MHDKYRVQGPPRRYSVRDYAVVTRCEGAEVLDHSPEGIPPSEVKGLVRTAYLHWLLMRDEDLGGGASLSPFLRSFSGGLD